MRSAHAERARLERVYGSYRAEDLASSKWDANHPGNRCILDERHRALERLLRTISTPDRVLEIGCGGGAVMEELAGSAGSRRAVGVDLLFDRLVTARDSGCMVLQADGRRLPFADSRFDLVALFTVFSSILDTGIRRSLVVEIQRVLVMGGRVLWYDLRYPSTNRAVRPLGRREVARLFPGWQEDLRSITVVPPLARSMGGLDRCLYPLGSRIPVLRSHLIGLLRAPSDGSRPGAAIRG